MLDIARSSVVLAPQRRVICVCGPPCGGKSLAGGLVQECFGWELLEADAVGREVAKQLVRRPVFEDDENSPPPSSYPYDDALLMEWEHAETFIQALDQQLAHRQAPVILVGIRSSQMLARLRSTYSGTLQVLYVSSGSRVCSIRHARLTGQSRRSYHRRLEYAVEADQSRLRQLANVVVHNGGTVDSLRARLLARVREDGRIFRGKLDHCHFCSELLPVHFRTGEDQAPVCKECYEQRFNSETCSRCGQGRPVHCRGEGGQAICKRCYQKLGNVRECAYCKRARPVHCRDEAKRPVCRSCSDHHLGGPKLELCHACHGLGRVARRDPEGPICKSCYERERRRRQSERPAARSQTHAAQAAGAA